MDREWIADTRGVAWMRVPENMDACRVAPCPCVHSHVVRGEGERYVRRAIVGPGYRPRPHEKTENGRRSRLPVFSASTVHTVAQGRPRSHGCCASFGAGGGVTFRAVR